MNKSKMVPKIRFSEYSDNWSQQQLVDMVDVNGGMDYKHLGKGNIPVYGTGGYMLSVDSALSKSNDAIGIGRKGTIDKPYILRAPFWTVDTLFYCIPKNDTDLEFVNCLFRIIDWKKKDESTGVPSLSKTIINNTCVASTSNKEQHKIGSFFSNYDRFISSHNREYKKLLLFREAIQEKIFPRGDSTIPAIRFHGYTEPWREYSFSELYKKVCEKNDLEFGTNNIISVASMHYKEDICITNSDYLKTYNIMRLGDIAFEGNKSKKYAHGRFVENTIGDGIVSHVFDVFRPNMEYDLYFWKYMINDEKIMGKKLARCTKSSTMMTNLVANDFLKEKILVPSINEQRQIGRLLKSIDDLIILYQSKSGKSESLEKTFLNKMLVKVEA